MTPVDPVSGCDLDDVRYLDLIEDAHLLLDEAERFLSDGQRERAIYAMGKAAARLESLS